MTLDDEDPKLIELAVGSVKGRMDFIEAVQMLHLAIAVAIQVLDEAPEMVELRDSFSSALELAVKQLEPSLSR